MVFCGIGSSGAPHFPNWTKETTGSAAGGADPLLARIPNGVPPPIYLSVTESFRRPFPSSPLPLPNSNPALRSHPSSECQPRSSPLPSRSPPDPNRPRIRFGEVPGRSWFISDTIRPLLPPPPFSRPAHEALRERLRTIPTYPRRNRGHEPEIASEPSRLLSSLHPFHSASSLSYAIFVALWPSVLLLSSYAIGF